jgi:hypothetical protein
MAESKGFRILKQQLEGNLFKIDIEGKSGSTYDFKLLVGTDIVNYSGAELIKKGTDGFAVFRVTIPADKEKYQQKTIQINIE